MTHSNTLFNTQALFQSALLDNHQQDILQHLVDDARVGVQKRLHIYQHAYQARMIEAAASNFPQLQRLLGEEPFAQCILAFLKQQPSTYRNMRWLGQTLPAYLQQHTEAHPCHAPLATFEWCLGLAFDAEDIAPLSLAALTQIAPEQWPNMRMTLHPSVQLQSAAYDVLSLWQSLNQGKPKKSHLRKKDIHYMVWRQDMTSYFKSISHDEFTSITALQQGARFGEICEHLCAHMDEAQAMQSMAQLVLTLIQSQALTAISLD